MRLFSSHVLLAATIGSVSAWGPISHQLFNCAVYFPDSTLADCLQQGAGALAVGSDFPDAFGFGAFHLDASNGFLCDNLTYVHDPFFGGFMVLKAMAEAGNGTWSNALPFSLGFVGHIMGDLVGFNKDKGVLCTSQSVSCNTEILYMPEWGYMSSIDAFYANSSGLSLSSSYNYPLPGDATMGSNAYAWIAEASREYSAVAAAPFPPVNAAQVESCANYWAGNMKYVFERSKFIAASPSRLQYLTEELTWFAPGNVTSISDYLKAQASCASRVIDIHFQTLTSTKNITAAVIAAGNLSKKLYTTNKCTTGRSF